MKAIKFVLPATAFLFAIVGALVTEANSNFKLLNATGYAQISANECRQVQVDESDCPESGSVVCKITVAEGTFDAHSAKSENTCQTPLLFRSN